MPNAFLFSSENYIELICFSHAPPFHDHSHGSLLLVSSSGESREKKTLQSFMRVQSQKLNIKFRLEDVHARIALLHFYSTMQLANSGVLNMPRKFRMWLKF